MTNNLSLVFENGKVIKIKTLVIAEKPSVAMDLAKVLGYFQRKDGYLENGQYLVSWAYGHLVELAEPQDYAPELNKWTLEQLPIVPKKFKHRPTKGAEKQLKVLKGLLNSPEVTEVVAATDAGREGESIFRRIYHYCKCNKPVKRLWLSETTPSAVREAFNNLRDSVQYDNLAAAAEARSQADWLTGINATRAFTVKHHTVLSVGRVQTPTLALLVDREGEIRNFKPEPYWQVWAEFKTANGAEYKGKWIRDDNDRFNQAADANAVVQAVKSAGSGIVTTIEQKVAREQAPSLFNLNDLQKEANRRYGMTAQQTLDAAQVLYEKHKLLTYPRTDSRCLTTAMQATLPDRLNAVKSISPYTDLIPSSLPKLGKKYVDDAKVSDHHAIIMTNTRPNPAALSKNEQQIYDLVVRRFLAIFYPDARYAVTKVITTAVNESFLSRGRVELEIGWKIVYRDLKNQDKEQSQDESTEDDQDQALPPLSKGDQVEVKKAESLEKKTKPPKRYTEAMLLSAMENAGKLVDDKEVADTLKATGGIGTPATRAAIIERLIKVSYIERQKKLLVPTVKGETLIDLVPEQVKSVELTANWEEGLHRIEEGQEDPDAWLTAIKNFTAEVVQIAKDQQVNQEIRQQKAVLGKCPLCGKDVVEGKKGYGCTGYKDGCRFIIWREVAGKKITVNQAKDLLTKNKTAVLKGFKGKSGNSFEAALMLNAEGKVKFEFPDANRETASLGKCPVCGKDVKETSKGYGCTGWKEGCKFIIWKEIAGKKITVKQARDLLQKGRTTKIKGFKSKANKQFEAVLVLQGDRVNFEFEKKN